MSPGRSFQYMVTVVSWGGEEEEDGRGSELGCRGGCTGGEGQLGGAMSIEGAESLKALLATPAASSKLSVRSSSCRSMSLSRDKNASGVMSFSRGNGAPDALLVVIVTAAGGRDKRLSGGVESKDLRI